MTIELTLLGWTLVLALIQILIPAMLRNGKLGLRYSAGPRDEAPPACGKIAGRFARAQSNLFETLPIFAIAILIAHLASRESILTYWGAWLYLIARIVYVLLYAAGIPLLRTLVWLVSFVGVVLVLSAIL